MTLRVIALVILCLFITAGFVSCRYTQTVVIVATEYEFQPSTIEVKAGQIRIVLRNAGNSSHALKVEGFLEKVIVAPGEEKDLVINLSPGNYRFTCPLGDHDDLGMIGNLVVHR